MEMETKTLPFATKARGGGASTSGRRIAGLASTADLDYHDDIVLPTAFSRTLAEWRKGGGTLPLLDSHQRDRIGDVLGKLVDFEILDDGLWTEWEIVNTPIGDEALERVRGGYVDGLSIGYRVSDADLVEVGGRNVRRLKDVDLLEVSLVIYPANPYARIQAAKPKADAGGALEVGDRRRLLLEARVAALHTKTSRGTPDPAGGMAAKALLGVPSGYVPGHPARCALEARIRAARCRVLGSQTSAIF